jgi:hypothetical protein
MPPFGAGAAPPRGRPAGQARPRGPMRTSTWVDAATGTSGRRGIGGMIGLGPKLAPKFTEVAWPGSWRGRELPSVFSRCGPGRNLRGAPALSATSVLCVLTSLSLATNQLTAAAAVALAPTLAAMPQSHDAPLYKMPVGSNELETAGSSCPA